MRAIVCAVLQHSIDEAVAATPGVEWAVSVRDAHGEQLVGINTDRAMRTASVGKLLLLVEAARQCEAGELSGATLLRRDAVSAVADSGLWQHLHVDELCVEDLCVLIASVSDNLATNVLLSTIGLPAVHALGDSLGLIHTALHDVVRDRRKPGDPPTLSTGSTGELSNLMSLLARDRLLAPGVSVAVNGWLATGVDLSMVAAAFGRDPLSHAQSARKLAVRNKTGSDPGVRADVGTIGGLAYAVIANWDVSASDRTDEVLAAMHAVGSSLRAVAESE